MPQTALQHSYTYAAPAALTASGTTTPVDFGGAVPTDVTYTVAATGAPTSISVQPQGSVDGVNFVNLGAAQTAAGLYTIQGTPLAAIQFAVTITGGTSPTVAIAVLAK
jgi:hypothetical protein